MVEASVRIAEVADAEEVAGLQLELWRTAYGHLLPPATLSLPQSAHAQSWAARIASGGPVLIATEGAAAVGFAAVDVNHDDAVTGEIEVLGILPRWSRRGHGGRLLGESARNLRERGAEEGIWWIPQADAWLAAFLATFGWGPDGTRRELDTGAAPLIEVRYRGTLDLVLL